MGTAVGSRVGGAVGAIVGSGDGTCVGKCDGSDVGSVGLNVGTSDGAGVGESDGKSDGANVGASVGAHEPGRFHSIVVFLRFDPWPAENVSLTPFATISVVVLHPSAEAEAATPAMLRNENSSTDLPSTLENVASPMHFSGRLQMPDSSVLICETSLPFRSYSFTDWYAELTVTSIPMAALAPTIT